jgi:hypothetical protein
MAVMRGDNIIVGSKPTTSKSTSMTVEETAERVDMSDTHPSAKKRRSEFCGAMSQQRCDSGAQSTPQKFVRLVGCRDPKIKPQPNR